MALDSRHLDDIAPSSSSVDRLRRKRLRPWESDKIPLDGNTSAQNQADTTPAQQRHTSESSSSDSGPGPNLISDTTATQYRHDALAENSTHAPISPFISDTTATRVRKGPESFAEQIPTQKSAARLDNTDSKRGSSTLTPEQISDTKATQIEPPKQDSTDTKPTQTDSDRSEKQSLASTQPSDRGTQIIDTKNEAASRKEHSQTDTTPAHYSSNVDSRASMTPSESRHDTDTSPAHMAPEQSIVSQEREGAGRHNADTAPTRKTVKTASPADTTPTQTLQRPVTADTTPAPHPAQRRHNAGTQSDTKSALEILTTPLALKGQKLHLLEYLVGLSMRTGTRVLRPLSYDALAQQSRIPLGSVRTTLKRLRNEGYVAITDHSKGRGATIEVEVHERVILAYGSGMNRWPSDGTADTSPTQHRHLPRHNTDTQSDTTRSSSSSSIDLKKLTNTETEAKRELPEEWSNIDATPLGSLGFTRTHVVQVYESGKLTAQQLQDSIYAFDFDLRENAKTKAINGPPLNYFMGIVRRGNPYVPPKNYKSPEDAALERYLEMSKQRQEREGRAMDAAFLEWSGNLTAEAKTKLVPTSEFARIGSPSHTGQLKEHFREQVWPDLRQRILRGAL